MRNNPFALELFLEEQVLHMNRLTYPQLAKAEIEKAETKRKKVKGLQYSEDIETLRCGR